MGLDKIRIEGFKSIKALDLELRSLNVLIGANGAGKSNFLSAFKLLSAISQGELQIFAAISGGPDSLLYFGRKVTDCINIELCFEHKEYRASLKPTPENKLIFLNEFVRIQAPKPAEMVWDFKEQGHQESALSLKAEKDRAFNDVISELKSWKVYHLNDTGDKAPVKGGSGVNDNFYLKPDGSNLAAFLYLLQHANRKHYDAIRDTIRLVAPFFKDFALRTNPFNDRLIQLEWHERGHDTPWLAHHLSDGTLRFMCLVTLLLQPSPPATILIDEPELGLHPYAINVLASLIKSSSLRTQIIVATQSVDLVSQFDVEDLLVVDRESPIKDNRQFGDIKKATEIRRLDKKDYADWLTEYSVGELWEKNVFGGRP